MNQTPQLNGLTALGASTAIPIVHGTIEHSFEAWFTHNASSLSPVSAVVIKIQGSLRNDGVTGVINTTGPVLAIGSTPEQVANAAFDYRINNVNYNKAAVVAGSAFTSQHVVTASKVGAINLYIDSAGTVLTLSTQLGQNQLTALASDNVADAITIAENIPVPANHAYLGYVLIEADGGGWEAVTDDLSTDLTRATFISASPAFVNLTTHTFSAPELVSLRAGFTLSNSWFKYMRIYLSTLTGTGKVYVEHIPGIVRGW